MHLTKESMEKIQNRNNAKYHFYNNIF